MAPGKYGENWSRSELILALYLYCQIPFAKTKANNPEVIRLAVLLGRTPASVARRLGNFGAFDPVLAAKGISGLGHTGRAARGIWDEFRNRWEILVEESNHALALFQSQMAVREVRRISVAQTEEEIISIPTGPSERQATVSVRLFQAFFRRTVLASYDCACGVCGLDIRELLSASHIKPWAVDTSVRTEPENGLCLCAIHDQAFDRGLLTISDKYRVIVASEILLSKQPFVRAALIDFHGQPLRMPKRFAPRLDLLEWHRLNLFEQDVPPNLTGPEV